MCLRVLWSRYHFPLGFNSEAGRLSKAQLVRTRDLKSHGLLTQARRNFSYGFSDKALKGQEKLIGGYFDKLIIRLREAEGEPVNMMKWYQLITFDIIGELTFGEGFDCLHEDTKLYVRESQSSRNGTKRYTTCSTYGTCSCPGQTHPACLLS